MNRLGCMVVAWVAWARLCAGELATAVAIVRGGQVADIVVTHGGWGYGSAPAVTLAGGGGNGATAIAAVEGGKVARVVVVQPGAGYGTAPNVAIDAPQDMAELAVECVPKLTLKAVAGSTVGVEWAPALVGPWDMWTNVVVGTNGAVLVDLGPGATARFYRVGSAGPPGFAWIPPRHVHHG